MKITKKISFTNDLLTNGQFFSNNILDSSILIIGGAGTIGSSYIKQILKFKPSKITVVDINENIVSLLTDTDNNLWGTNSYSASPLFCKTNQDEWIAFNMPFVANQSTEIGEMIIDDYGKKWGIRTNNGLFVYNDNNTIWDKSDDQFTKITTGLGSGNLPNNYVYCLANDLEGNIWAGTKEGVCVFYSPSSVFSGYNFDAQQILIQEGEYGQYLLSSEKINCIEIDGANRKWFATNNSGAILTSANGTAELIHFTAENSPLFSNKVVDIEVNDETGEVFFATDKGLISYRAGATKGSNNFSNVLVFPNPVKPNYQGSISIKGLLTDAEVKITDVSGNLVYKTKALGGQANWDGMNYNNERVGTGVYLVFSTDENGYEKAVSKILFIK